MRSGEVKHEPSRGDKGGPGEEGTKALTTITDALEWEEPDELEWEEPEDHTPAPVYRNR